MFRVEEPFWFIWYQSESCHNSFLNFLSIASSSSSSSTLLSSSPPSFSFQPESVFSISNIKNHVFVVADFTNLLFTNILHYYQTHDHMNILLCALLGLFPNLLNQIRLIPHGFRLTTLLFLGFMPKILCSSNLARYSETFS